MGSTRLDLPVAWLGSTMTGRWVFSWMMGTADRSRVLRVYFSKVRMPRSQRITCSLPPAMIYSALMIHSSMVLHRPRLSRTGLCILPTALSSWKFCILRAPIWTTSTYSSNSGMRSSLISSETMGRPVASRALTMSRMPSVSRPWKE